MATTALVSVVAAAALVASPALASTATASTSSATSLAKLVNENRVDVALPAFASNHVMDDYAQGYSDFEAKCPTCGVLTTDIGLQGSASHSKYVFTVTGSTAKSRISRAMLYLEAHYGPEWEATTSNYDAVGWTTKGTKTWVTFAIADYTSTPFNELGHASFSGTVAVGKTLTAKVSGYSPSATGTTYSWNDGSMVLSTLPTYQPTGGELGHTITLMAHVTRPGYITLTYEVKVGVVKVGTLIHPSTLPLDGPKHVGQWISFYRPLQWSGVTNFTPQWLRNGKPIPGATGLSYTLTSADLGKHVNVKVIAAAVGYKTITMQTHSTTDIGKPYLPILSHPTIMSPPTVGGVLTGTPTAWGVTPTHVTSQWYVGGKVVAGATRSTFVVPASALGKQVVYRQVATLSGYSSTIAQSNDSAAVARGTIQTVEFPSLSGNEIVGQKLLATKGEYNPSSVTVTFQWYDGTKAIKGATGSTHTVTAADLVVELLLKITVKKSGYTTLSGFYSR